MASVELRDLTKRFGSVTVVDNVALRIDHGQLVCLLGPSGCGKTTTLRCVAGLEKPDAGRIVVAGSTVADGRVFVPPHRRDIGMVFQSYAIWPHLTVFANVAFACESIGRPGAFCTRNSNELPGAAK